MASSNNDVLCPACLPIGPAKQARAKVELREQVTEQDAKDVVDMMQEVKTRKKALQQRAASSSLGRGKKYSVLWILFVLQRRWLHLQLRVFFYLAVDD